MDDSRLLKLEEQNEELSAQVSIEEKQVSIEEKKAIIAQAKAKYGKNWKDVFKGVHSGLDWQALKFQLK